MPRTSLTALVKRAVTPVLAVSLAIALVALYESNSTTPSSRERQAAATATQGSRAVDVDKVVADKDRQDQTLPGHSSLSADQRLADITIVVLDNGRDRPLGFKLGGQYIKLPAPSSWPHIGNQGTVEAGGDRYLAAIIDTADVLQANGFKPDHDFSLVVGDTELNAGNTFRIKGNHQAAAFNNGGEPDVEYRTQAGEQGIWRSLKFKNIVVSHAQVPSLEAHLVSAPPSTGSTSYHDSAALATSNGMESTLPTAPSPLADTAQVTPLLEPTPESTRKYVEALDSADPAVRADAIQSLIINGYREAALGGDTSAKMESIIAKSLLDKNPAVRSTAMDALDGYEGSVPQGTLSHMALNDSNPGLRIQALDLLVERFGDQATPTLNQARHDPDPRVGRMASELLTELADKTQQ